MEGQSLSAKLSLDRKADGSVGLKSRDNNNDFTTYQTNTFKFGDDKTKQQFLLNNMGKIFSEITTIPVDKAIVEKQAAKPVAKTSPQPVKQ